MIITISGVPGSGKSTVAKLVAKTLGVSHYSIGDLMRSMAKERNIDWMEFTKLAITDKSIDEELDRKLVELGNSKDTIIVDTRIGFYFIPHSFKIFFQVDLGVAAKRIHSDLRSEEKSKNVAESKKKIVARIDSEITRYKELYGINCYDPSNYDLVIDTTNISVEEVVNKVISALPLDN